MGDFHDDRPSPSRRHYPLSAAVIALILASAVFAAFPLIDIETARLFHRADHGFWLASDPQVVFLRHLGRFFTIAVLAVSFAAFLVGVGPWRHLLPAYAAAKASLYLMLTALLAPGLIVNGVLKTYWGRARPHQTDMFDGVSGFSTPWILADGCERNCSFASGEAAFAFWLLALVPLFPPKRRMVAALAIGGFAVSISSLRVIAGGHYLSDAVIGALITLVVVAAVHRLFFTAPTAPRIDRTLDRITIGAAPSRPA